MKDFIDKYELGSLLVLNKTIPYTFGKSLSIENKIVRNNFNKNIFTLINQYEIEDHTKILDLFEIAKLDNIFTIKTQEIEILSKLNDEFISLFVNSFDEETKENNKDIIDKLKFGSKNENEENIKNNQNFNVFIWFNTDKDECVDIEMINKFLSYLDESFEYKFFLVDDENKYKEHFIKLLFYSVNINYITLIYLSDLSVSKSNW